MAVYTQLSRADIEAFLARYACGALQSFDGILQGVENTNYKIVTDQNAFILTAFEKRTNEKDLPFIFAFMNHLQDREIYCPRVIEDSNGKTIGKILGKSAALLSFLDKGGNVSLADITPDLCRQMGALMARMHVAAADFKQARQNSMSLAAWKDIFEDIAPSADTLELGTRDLMAAEISRAEKTLSSDLPKAAVHADLFPDNVFAVNGHVTGIIDFYFSATDYLSYDLAITFNAWCFENGVYQTDRGAAMFAGYQSIRPLLNAEKDAFQDMARAAALRILMTRSFDWLHHDPSNLVKAKDPLEYKKILEFHVSNRIEN